MCRNRNVPPPLQNLFRIRTCPPWPPPGRYVPRHKGKQPFQPGWRTSCAIRRLFRGSRIRSNLYDRRSMSTFVKGWGWPYVGERSPTGLPGGPGRPVWPAAWCPCSSRLEFWRALRRWELQGLRKVSWFILIPRLPPGGEWPHTFRAPPSLSGALIFSGEEARGTLSRPSGQIFGRNVVLFSTASYSRTRGANHWIHTSICRANCELHSGCVMFMFGASAAAGGGEAKRWDGERGAQLVTWLVALLFARGGTVFFFFPCDYGYYSEVDVLCGIVRWSLDL